MGTRLDRKALPLVAGLLALAMSSFVPRPAVARDNPYGMDIHSPSGAELTLFMDKLRAAGIGWAHVAVIWPYVESSPGTYDWSVYDAIVAAAQQRQINVLATILYTPAWATSYPTWTGIPDTTAWVNFCTTAAARYKGSINYWGLWNEPNLAEFWAGSRQQYIDLLLKPGADAIHAANPMAHVGGPALAHLGSAKWYDWLDDVILQAGDHLDFVTHHVYDTSGNRQVTSKLNDSTVFGNSPELWSIEPPSVREVLHHSGWFGRPFWLTETGWQSQPNGEAQQAAYYGGMLTDWFTDYPGQTWIDKIFFYEMIDYPPNGTTWGILRADGSAKQAYEVYQNFITAHTFQPVDDAQLVASTLPTSMETGQTITVRLTFKNTGVSTWTEAAQYRLAAANDQDAFAAPRQFLAPGDAIAPGQQVTFSFSMTAPASPGTYHTQWQMLKEGLARFGGIVSQNVVVAQAPPRADLDLPLLSDHFSVEVSWHDPISGHAGFGRQVADSGQTGFFWFFDATNLELVVKMLDGRAVNGHYWFFYGGLSNVEYWITVNDLASGAVRTYYNPPGNICGGADASAFPLTTGAGAPSTAGPAAVPQSAPARYPTAVPVAAWTSQPFDGGGTAADASGSCVPGPQNLCLLASRFQVTARWSLPAGPGTGTAVTESDQTGAFWFFDPTNLELLVKVIDGRSLTGHFWVFYGALSNVEYWVKVTDTVTGASKRYHNSPGNICGVGDTAALD
jgi:hypothetical protein